MALPTSRPDDEMEADEQTAARLLPVFLWLLAAGL